MNKQNRFHPLQVSRSQHVGVVLVAICRRPIGPVGPVGHRLHHDWQQLLFRNQVEGARVEVVFPGFDVKHFYLRHRLRNF